MLPMSIPVISAPVKLVPLTSAEWMLAGLPSRIDGVSRVAVLPLS